MFKSVKKSYTIIITLMSMLIMLFSCTNLQKGKLIKPLYTPINMNNIQDGIYRIDLESNDIKEKNGNTYFTPKIYSEDIYDTVDIHNIKIGDRILNSGKEELVESIHWDKDKSSLCINFPSFEEAVEVYRPSESGGTYYVEGPDGHHSYTLRGKANILVDDNLIMIDSSRWGEPDENILLINLKEYMENGYEHEYNFLNTYIQTENNKVIELVHHYIP